MVKNMMKNVKNQGMVSGHPSLATLQVFYFFFTTISKKRLLGVFRLSIDLFHSIIDCSQILLISSHIE